MQNKETTILAIDPGYDRCGIALFSYNGKATLLHSECIVTTKEKDHGKRLLLIAESIEKLIKKLHPTLLAIETLFFSINKKTAIKVAEARGVILATAAKANLDVIELSPQAVKLSSTGRGNADKKQVQKMVSVILKRDIASLIDDEVDAMAIGLAACEELRIAHLKH